MKQPQVEHYYEWLRREKFWGEYLPLYSEKSKELLDELFELIKQIKPIHPNGVRTLWFRAGRGTLEDFGDPKEVVADGDFETEEEFIEEWKWRFPNEWEWYQFEAVEFEDEHYRAITLKHHHVIVQDERREEAGFEYDISEFVQWLLESLKECIEMLKAGTYNDFVRRNLPPEHRTGTIVRKHLWDAFPDARASFFENILEADVKHFCEMAYAQPVNTDITIGRLKEITANDFYRFCALGYAENRYNGCDTSPKEQYYLHADGRDNGLSEIDPDSPEAFADWMENPKRGGGHPWEVCRGGNSTHVALGVHQDENGYFLVLAGDAWNRTIETVKFYLALRREGIPVFLHEATTLADRLMEKEKIGIVPEGVLPTYCESWFPNEHVIDYMNLPLEEVEKLLPFCNWQDIEPIELNEK